MVLYMIPIFLLKVNQKFYPAMNYSSTSMMPEGN